MNSDALSEVASLCRRRNEIDAQIAAIIRRPPVSGHLAEWLAAQVFDIELETSANARAIDGRFRSGPLRDRTLNVKGYGKWEYMLDMTEAEELDYYLVLTGPKATSLSSAGGVRPWCVDHVFLFDARELVSRLRARPKPPKIGTATSVARRYWLEAEVYPGDANPLLTLTTEQTRVLDRFRSIPIRTPNP